ncbi:uncharacterized protein LOC142324031 [Lycorma delicatula]|uniref:uncharacterized protein LOC142324031 n=1 Tax=Lycorma delicatula TaxID=130591 RepID=UPI003F515AD2
MNLGIEHDIETDIVKVVDEDGGKRLLSELDVDQERGHVKKRRKQSKPVRIASSDSLSDGESYVDKVATDKQKRDLKFNDEADSSFNKISQNNKVNDTINNEEEYDLKRTDDNRDDFEQSCNREDNFRNKDNNFLLPINLSNAKNSTNFVDSFVRAQISDSSPTNNVGKTQTTQDITTSPYQESCFEGIQYKKDNTFVSSSSSPLSFPAVKSVHIPNSAPHSGSPLRIFNPEAFCDLCNKEFCNKYFLKTHKANKHGIYMENIGPNVIDALPSLPFINYFSNVNEVIPSATHISRTPLRKPQLTVCLPQQNVTSFLKNIGNGNTRAFCNICQREFCNKYFVRRHKAKIHGIIDTNFPDTPPDGQDQKSQNASDSKMCIGNQEKCDDADMHSGLSQSRTIAGFTINSTTEKENKECNFSTSNKEHESNAEQTLPIKHDRESDSDESMSAEVMTGTNNNPSIQSIFNTQQCQSDDICNEIESVEKMKKILIVNSEAFCDICCKEYCNKYFLRTHKMKSHGIIPSDCERRDERSNGNENSSLFSNQVMPLNLIVGDHCSEKVDKMCSDVENDEIFCNLCGQKFKNIFLLKMHTSYMHPQESSENPLTKDNNSPTNDEKGLNRKQVVKSDSNAISENSQKSISDEEKCFGFDFQNSHSMMLKCEICHKGFDPASLEVHIENEHANLLEEIGAMGEEENSNSQLSIHGLKIDCNSCQKQFTNTSSLDQHIIECHGATGDQFHANNSLNVKAAKENDDLLKINQMQGMYSTAEIQTPPTSSFCEICKKELCNKYFMKTHMQRMHGISIENGAHIGGVVCDICNKELCSKYFLRVHKQNSHGIVDEILGLDISRNQSPNTDPSLKPLEQNDLNSRYFSHFTEVCAICSRRFRSMKWLKAHLLNDHGEEGKEKWKEFQSNFELRLEKYPKDVLKKSDTVNIMMGNSLINTSSSRDGSDCLSKNNPEGYTQRFETSSSPSSCQVNGNSENNIKNSVFTTIFNGKNTNTKQYQCSYCPFSTSILAFLFVHERSHISGSNLLLEQNQRLQCKICSLTFDNNEDLEKHHLSHNLSRSVSFGGDIHNGKLNESLNQTECFELVKGKEILENENQLKDVGRLKESASPLQKASEICTKERGIFEFNKSILGESAIRVFKEQLRSDESVMYPGEVDYNVSIGVPISDGLRKSFTSDERLRHDSDRQIDDEVNGALIQVKESLELIANKTEIPVSFSVPNTQKSVIMQPFILEDSGEFMSPNTKKVDFNKSFLSSIVFLPVKERLKNPVMVSFKLTPT